jgi:hypothetical protein
MVQRCIDPTLSVEVFFAVLNRRGIRYTVLRWFEELPNGKPGDAIDLLVHDDDLVKIKDLFVALPTGASANIYSVSALPGASYRTGVPLYPSHLAREILESSVWHKDAYRVPDLRRHFLSLAYRAAYHKPEGSGLAHSRDDSVVAAGGEHTYRDTLLRLGESLGLRISPDLQSLRELLAEQGWAPRLDVVRRTAAGSRSLTALARGNSTRRLPPAGTIRYPLDVHGVKVLIESNSAVFMEYARRDFCFFYDRRDDHRPPHVRITFLQGNPPWEEIPRSAVPLFRTSASTVYKQGPIRYVDHDREVLGIYDLKCDQGTVYSNDPEAMYRTAYGVLMTRIGRRLDGVRRHRMHALGITLNERALLFLGHRGCGKSTLGMEMMKHSQVGWLTDDILPVDPHGRALAFPTSPRLIEGSTVSWLPAGVTLLRAPMPKSPPKVQLPSWSILSRVRASAQIGAVFLCSRQPGFGPSIRRAGFIEALWGMCENALSGRHLGHMRAYHLLFSPAYAGRTLWIYLSRLLTFISIARTVPVFRFEMGGRVPENAALLLETWAAMRNEAGS